MVSDAITNGGIVNGANINGTKSPIENAGRAGSVGEIRRIGWDDLKDALAKGFADFKEKPSHLILLVIIYPIIGVVLIGLTSGGDLRQLIFPIISGFALIGPIAAIGLYELSRRRELGLDVSWKHAINIIHSPSISAIVRLSMLLGAIYIAWIVVAQMIFSATLGDVEMSSSAVMLEQVFSSSAGWSFVIIGCGIGFVFAVVVLAISAVSFPMLLDREVGIGVAVKTSVKVFLANPKTMLLWGGIVVVFLVLGSLPMFIGLTVAMPVLGHATWHLYRKAVGS